MTRINDKKGKAQLIEGLQKLRRRVPQLRSLNWRRRLAKDERDRLLTALWHRNAQLQTAAQVSRAASNILDPDELIQMVVALVRERFDLYYAGLFLTDPTGKWAILRAGSGEAGRRMLEEGHKLEVGDTSMIGWCVAHEQARIALDVGEEAVRFENPHLPETRSELALPLVSRGRAIGALTIQSSQEAAFSNEDITVLQTMADQLANAIENARLYNRAQQEISERKQVEKALRDSEARYRTLVTQSPIGVVTCDRAGHVTHVNPALLQILGSPSEEASRQFNVLTLPNMVEAGMAADFRRCMEEATQITAEYPHCSYWGKESVLRLRMIPLRDERGAVSGALATVEDVTEQRRLQEQLIQSAKLASIGQLAAGVAHEINNPINGIINYAQLLLNKVDEAKPGSRETRFIEGILREGSRVADIVRDLLTFSRVETEAHSPAHVSDILRATLTLTGQQLKNDSIILEIEEQPDLPQVKCRSQRIQQVFLNLISNARDALNARYPEGDPNKRLTIRIEQVEKDGQLYVQIAFRDCGVGIPAENLPHVFTPFFTTKRPDEGTGLGLSVSYGIIQDHHGDIQVESIEGEYTVFRVDLPVDNGWEL